MNTKQRARYAVIAVGLFIFAHVYHMTVEFFDTHVLQSPIVIRKPYKDRFVDPVGDIRATPIVEPNEKVLTPTATPTPPKPKKALKLDVVSDVEASELPSDAKIIDYICSKDWDCKTAVALAKSENFWNLTKSFDCTRQGGMNKNGTRDHGLWQINDIHISSGAITLDDALDCYKATDFAYGLYKGRGDSFSAWSAFNNGSYLGHL